ncbi:Ssn8 protein [Candida orthopsilosis Co 90-125]|uniref:RNA polymerase II holoenzyme cyclin-like subunit n=1 Tax=Candida orthopsilosis (strain 90-125) TaxID=1136231 RepID=H8X2N9_CANO9|nr:Ssn8 protein [Candida orthopsilosis Co 90-125]CCG25586.1 Ssn8 protein [Candida orthopsilosis Co 90-125]
MSADYWNSSQRNQWQLTRFSLLEARRKIIYLERKMIQNGLIKDSPNINYDYNMRIYLHNLMLKLGRRMNVRQVAIATAEVYCTRFLTRVSLKEINVYLLVTTCLYVACKIEECPQHIRLIVSEARNLWPEYIPQDVTKLAEFEFYLIEEMDSYLLLHHPYKSLLQLKNYFEQKYGIYGFKLTDEELQNCWSLINDSYITDLHLLLPPHIIAVAAVYITIVLKKNLSQLKNKDENGSAEGNNTNSSNNIGTSISQQDYPQAMNNSNKPGSTDGFDNSSANKELNIDDLMNLSKPNSQENGKTKSAEVSPSKNGNTQSASQKESQGNTNHPSLQQPTKSTHTAQDLVNFDLDILDEDTIRINKFMNFLEHSHINLDEVVEAVQDMVNVYVLWNRYNEQSVRKALQVMLWKR